MHSWNVYRHNCHFPFLGIQIEFVDATSHVSNKHPLLCLHEKHLIKTTSMIVFMNCQHSTMVIVPASVKLNPQVKFSE